MRTLLIAAALLTLALAPTAAADAGNPLKDTVGCLFGMYFPETSVYQIVWNCTLGAVFPEPVEHFTGCVPSSPPDLDCVAVLRLPPEGEPCDWFALVEC